MDEQGVELPRGEAGELWIAGPMVVPGYGLARKPPRVPETITWSAAPLPRKASGKVMKRLLREAVDAGPGSTSS